MKLRSPHSIRNREETSGASRCLRVLCALGIVFLAGAGRAQNSLQLSADPLSAGSEVQLELHMNFSQPTVGGAIRLAYDPAGLALERIEFGPGLGDDPDFRCPDSVVIDCPADPNFISFGSVGGLTGQNTVAVVTLRFLEIAPTVITLETASAFGGVDGSELSVELSGVVVEAGIPVPFLSPGLTGLLVVTLFLIGFGGLRHRRSAHLTSGTCIFLTMIVFTPATNAQSTADSDGDGILDSVDNCTLATNAEQLDSNGDGYGNFCDPDLDGNHQVDETDLDTLKTEFFGSNADADLNGNGTVDFLDLAVMANYYGNQPGPKCDNCPLSTESGEFSSEPEIPISIPDDSSEEASDFISISETGVIFDLKIWLRISHGWVGDLVVTLSHVETGTSVRLIDRPGVPDSSFGCSGSHIDAILDDEATESVEDTCDSETPTVSGNLRPEEALSAFQGEGISGTWVIAVTDVSLGVSGAIEGWGFSINSPPAAPTVDMIAFRPQSETYGNPLIRRAVSEADEDNLGAGIRINGDDDDGNGTPDRDHSSINAENDLVEVELQVYAAPAEPGLEYVIRRTHDHIKVWDSSDKNLSILDANDESILDFDRPTRSVWVESPNGGEAFLEFEVREIQSLSVISIDRIRFFSFTSLVIGLHGEFQFPTDPVYGPNEGISVLAVALHEEAYDSHMYIENEVEADGSGAVYDEIVSAIQNRGVTNLALYGFSHGAGSIYDLSERLEANRTRIGDFELLFTGYIDAIENDSDVDLDPEVRLPIGTQYHVNYYQSSIFWWIWGDSVPGADVDELITGVSHISITNSPVVQNGIHDPLVLLVPR